MANEKNAARLKDLELGFARANKEFQKKISPVEFTLPTTGWVNDTTEASDYKYYYEVTHSGLTANDVVNCNIALSSLSNAENFAPVTKSFAGKFRIYAKKIPSVSVKGEYYILAGKS